MTKQVLVAEDQREIRELICLFVESFFDARTYPAVDGLNGLEILHKHPDIDLIITDLDMPRLNGIELAHEVAKQKQLADKPILMITSEGPELRETALNAGVCEYFDKPFDPAALTPTVAKYIERR